MLAASARRLLRRSSFLAAFVLCVALFAGAGAQAQTPPTLTPFVGFSGWNLISFAGSNNYDDPTELNSPLYTLQPGDTNYRTTDLRHLVPGQGYWAHFTGKISFTAASANPPYRSMTVPAGQCVMLGNPSAKASARVTGADAVFTYSTVLNSYIQESLVPIGRGAWACNYSAAPENVTIGDQGDVVPFSTSDLVGPSPYAANGQAHFVLKNDSPYPMIVATRRFQNDGTLPPTFVQGDITSGQIGACSTCTEYPSVPQHSCSNAATFASVDVNPGVHEFHIVIDGRNVPDYLGLVVLQPNMAYTLCVWVTSDRPQARLP